MLDNISSAKKRSILILLIIAVALPFTFALVKQNQIFRPRAEEAAQVHSVVNFDPKVAQIIYPGDTLEGKGIPEAKVSISITPDGANGEANVDSEGKWTYQVPGTLQPKNYNLTIILEDVIGNIASIKTYSIKIVQQKSLGVISIPPPRWMYAGGLAFIKPAYAQAPQCSQSGQYCLEDKSCYQGTGSCQNYRCIYDPTGSYGTCVFDPGFVAPSAPAPVPTSDLEALGPEYQNWLFWMHKLSIYPAWDKNAGEIVYVNRNEYESKVCNNPDPGRPKCTANPQVDEFISQVEIRNFTFLQYLGDYIRRQCYIASDVMKPNFPDLTSIELDTGQTVNFFSKEDFPSLSFLHEENPNCGGIIKQLSDDPDVAQKELGNLITAAAANYTFSQEDPFGDFYNATKVATLGFLPTDTILKLVAVKSSNEAGYKYNNQVILDASFAAATFIPAAKAGTTIQPILQIGRKILSPRTVLKQRQMAARAATVRSAIENGQRVSKDTVTTEIAKAVDDIPVSPLKAAIQPTIETLRPKSTEAREFFEEWIKPYLFREGGEILLIGSREVLKKIKDDTLSYINNFVVRTGRNISLNPLFADAMDNGRVFIVDSARFDNTYRGITLGADPTTIGGFRLDDIIVLRKRSGGELFSTATLYHEVWHMAGGVQPYNFGFPGLNFKPDSPFFKSLKLVMEVMTNYGADVSRNIVPFSQGSKSIIGYGGAAIYEKGIFDRLIKKYPDLLDDFIEFSLNWNGPRLLEAVAQKTGGPATEAEFLRWFEGTGINLKAIVPIGAPVVVGSGLGIYLITVPRQPSIQVEPDIFIDDEEIEIISPDRAESGQTLDVSILETESGVISAQIDQLKEVFALEAVSQASLIKEVHAQTSLGLISQVRALAAEEVSPNTYQIIIPSGTSAGSYKLCGYMHRQGADDILDFDCEPIGIGVTETAPASNKQVISLKINGQDVDLSNPEVNVRLSGEEGIPGISIVTVNVTYYEEGVGETYGTYYLPFNYLNYQGGIPGVPNEIPVTPVPGEEGEGGSPTPTRTNNPGPRGIYILRGNPCGAYSGSNATLTCEPGSSCSSPTYGTCVYNYSVPTQIPVNVVNPTSVPTPTLSCKQTNQTCNNDSDCCQQQGLRCVFGAGAGKVCR